MQLAADDGAIEICDLHRSFVEIRFLSNNNFRNVVSFGSIICSTIGSVTLSRAL